MTTRHSTVISRGRNAGEAAATALRVTGRYCGSKSCGLGGPPAAVRTFVAGERYQRSGSGGSSPAVVGAASCRPAHWYQELLSEMATVRNTAISCGADVVCGAAVRPGTAARGAAMAAAKV